MSVELKVPSLGESITEVIVARWIKQPGEQVEIDDPVVELESDKVTMEMPAPAAGVMGKLLKKAGDSASVGEIIGYLESAGGAPAEEPRAKTSKTASKPAKEAPKPKAPPVVADEEDEDKTEAAKAELHGSRVMPAAQRLMSEKNVKPADVEPTGPGGRILKEDVQRRVEGAPAPAPKPAAAPAQKSAAPAPAPVPGSRAERRVPMTPIRRTIAERLVEAQKSAALLTTFNEVDMHRVMDLRKRHQDAFLKRHGVKLGFMSFFVKAAIEALHLVPEINARIEGQEIIYHDYCDVGVAIGGGKGLLVPVLRNAETMSFAGLEKAIADFADRAGQNKIAIEELMGGTFTISNGGIYGSMLSTPIINPPQSGILGMHNIVKRAVVTDDDQIVIRPMMYVALTYDHRIVDGRGAVTFLKRIKECIEDPDRMLIEA